MSERYMVGVDGSDPGRAALRWAARRATDDGARLTVVHVEDDDLAILGESGRAEEAAAGSRVLAAALAELETDFPALRVDAVVEHGPLAWVLASRAEPGDVVVVGTHKVGYLHGRVLGSRSIQVAALSRCTVAVVPGLDLRFREGVVAGIDRAETAAGIAEAAADEAARRGEGLLLLESVPTGSERDRAELPIELGVAAARARHPLLEVRSRISTRSPAEALLDAARTRAVLVLGPGSTAPHRSPIGSVLHDVLVNANSVVLVARATPETTRGVGAVATGLTGSTG